MGIKGVRVPVKLPFKGATDNSDQFVSMKQPVAQWLKFNAANDSELEYQVDVKKKGDATGTTRVTRIRRPGYRTRAVRVSFGVNSRGTAKKVNVGGNQVGSVQFPITSSVAIADVVKYFKSGNGRSLGVTKVTEANTGQSYPVATA